MLLPYQDREGERDQQGGLGQGIGDGRVAAFHGLDIGHDAQSVAKAADGHDAGQREELMMVGIPQRVPAHPQQGAADLEQGNKRTERHDVQPAPGHVLEHGAERRAHHRHEQDEKQAGYHQHPTECWSDGVLE